MSTVQALGWAGTKNGALLTRASGLIDALVTMDRNLEHQQDISVLPFGVVVVGAPSNRVPDPAWVIILEYGSRDTCPFGACASGAKPVDAVPASTP